MKPLPLIIGAVSLAGVVGAVAWEWSHLTSPGPLHPSHAGLVEFAGPSGCAVCHGTGSGASPMADACAKCHDDVKWQVDTATGLHGDLNRDTVNACGSCHHEHSGGSVALVSDLSFEAADVPLPRGYTHQHTPAFELSGRHSQIACDRCHPRAHAPALTRGQKRYLGVSQECRTCHEDAHEGAFGERCASCHGQTHEFKTPSDFSHTARFPLENAHAAPSCAKCHESAGPTSVGALHGKTFTVRSCTACHDDPHRGALGVDCASCHGTAVPFDRAPGFRHTELFPLAGSHGALACKDCHESSGARSVASLRDHPLPARACVDCLASPHRPATLAALAAQARRVEGVACVECHTPEHATFLTPAATMTAQQHRATGFALDRPHNTVECAACHAELGKREALAAGPDLGDRFAALFPGRAQHDCAACHRDPHRGQFAKGPTAGLCVKCHERTHFIPASFDTGSHDRTKFPLTGGHLAVACAMCHTKDQGATRFVPTPTACASCHQDVHEGGFDGPAMPASVDGRVGCARCHSTAAFDEVRWSAAEHALWAGYPLKGGHAAARCTECHRRSNRPDSRGRTLGAAPTSCGACHADPHAGQFARGDGTDCARCHSEERPFAQISFDHNRDSAFSLDQKHASLECASCHRAVEAAPGRTVVRYKPLGTTCQDCHDPRSREGRGHP